MKIHKQEFFPTVKKVKIQKKRLIHPVLMRIFFPERKFTLPGKKTSKDWLAY